VILVRKANQRGVTKTDWLQSFHTFSFADYYDPQFLGFGNLLVINEDTVQPGAGFGLHPHEDMEIISYVVEGMIEHRDSIGQSQVLKAGEIQRMSAGHGIKHSEYNPSHDKPLHFLQIWITPKQKGLEPSYEQKLIPHSQNDLVLLGASEGGNGALKIHQDVNLYYARLLQGNSIAYSFDETSYGWLQVISGNLVCNEEALFAGDGIAIIDESRINVESLSNETMFLLFDFMRK
jgi:redox-sensitive bicupin YhaK (pirin superfamily)